MEELEKLTGMYEKGLLTDEEFTLFKKKLIDNYQVPFKESIRILSKIILLSNTNQTNLSI